MTVLDSGNWGLTPAMEAGLFQKPQDRIFIIELENSIVSFINSNTESFQLRPMNSYYRLLSHQIAEYHNLNHVLARTQDSCVILFKGENFQKIEGKPLLQELQLSKKPEESVSSSESIDKSNNNRIFRILKRKEVNNDRDSKTDGNVSNNKLTADFDKDQKVETDDKSSTDLEQERIEKERLYEQRKQEIFDKLNKNENDGKSTNSSGSNDSDNEWGDWLNGDDSNTLTSNGSVSSSSPFNSSTTTTQLNKPHQQFYDCRRGRGGRRRGAGNYKDAYRVQNRRNKENGGYQSGYPTPYVVYPPPQMGSNSMPTYPLMYNPAGPAPGPAPTPMVMGGNTVFMNPYMYNMNSQGSCSFGAPVPMYPPYQYQYQYPYNTQYHNGPYSNTPNYNSNSYTRTSANKYNQPQRKNSSSGVIQKHNDGNNNNQEIRRAIAKGSPSTKDTNSVEMKFDKLNI
ncbi:Rbs1p [Saccharomyces paradoxus]|uniref:Rbs1p n=1 Tax=Saccharomyces paradoxus TaxID=27291 RepID=A0A8B8UMU8_SACPA|nr:Rbs1 [Saccharomyces paradoxus]QHS72057.1 Rbs1 [Saccharomyces paradoxus]